VSVSDDEIDTRVFLPREVAANCDSGSDLAQQLLQSKLARRKGHGLPTAASVAFEVSYSLRSGDFRTFFGAASVHPAGAQAETSGMECKVVPERS
jgi:hypothetical protein